MKYSVFTVMTPEFTPEEIVGKLARLNYKGVEWRVVTVLEKKEKKTSFWKGNKCTLSLQTLRERADYIKKVTEKENLKICNLATYLKANEFEKIERAMQIAKIMTCPQIRVNAPAYEGGLNYNNLFEETKKNLEEVEKFASKYGIKALLELHMGNIIPSASAAYRLVSSFDPNCIGVIYDPGNMIYEGYENWQMGMQLLGEYLAHIHIKNASWVIEKKDKNGVFFWKPTWARLKEGFVNWKEIMDALKIVGYKGYLSFEDFSDIPTEKKLTEDIEYLKSLEYGRVSK